MNIENLSRLFLNFASNSSDQQATIIFILFVIFLIIFSSYKLSKIVINSSKIISIIADYNGFWGGLR